MATASKSNVGHAPIAHVHTLGVQYIARARVAVHVAAEHQVHLRIAEQLLQLTAQVLCNTRGDWVVM